MAKPIKKDLHRAQSSRDIEKHITGEAEVIDSGDIAAKDVKWDVKQGEVHSDIRLEDDIGYGDAVILRSFDFKANPQTFKENPPTTQELFNAHLRQLEIHLMKDGLKVYTEASPQIRISKDKTGYRIVVPAQPMKGHRLLERPHTLTELAHGQTQGDRK